MTISRRGMFGFLGIAAGAVAAPVTAGGVALFDPGRRVTHLPGGGALIEDQEFSTGIAIYGSYNTVSGCTFLNNRPADTGVVLLGDGPVADWKY